MTEQRKSKRNNLTMANVKKQYKQAHSKQGYELKDGNNLTFYPIFPHGDIEKLLNEMGQQFKYAGEKEIEISEKFTFDYVIFLCIKYFTHLGKDISNVFEEQLSQMEWLVDTGYFKEIAEDIFDQKEIQKVFDKAVEITSTFAFLEKLTEQMQKSVKDLEIKNADTLAAINIENKS